MGRRAVVLPSGMRGMMEDECEGQSMKCVTYLCTASGTVKQPVSLLQGVVPRAKGHMGYL